MNNFTDEQIKEAARKAARRYLAQGESEVTIDNISISRHDEEATVTISWDYEGREEDDLPPDDMIFTVSVVDGELHVHGPEF